MKLQKGCLMLRRFITGKSSNLDKPIERVMEHMQRVEPDTEEYDRLMAHLERLTRLKREERLNRVSPDTMALVAGNLLGILIIVAYERNHVMVSKGLGHILRTKQ
jgi:hypothetical protein